MFLAPKYVLCWGQKHFTSGKSQKEHIFQKGVYSEDAPSELRVNCGVIMLVNHTDEQLRFKNICSQRFWRKGAEDVFVEHGLWTMDHLWAREPQGLKTCCHFRVVENTLEPHGPH